MPEFSRLSVQRLATCDDRLQKIFNEVIKDFDCTIICGHRDKDSQEDAFARGLSQKRYPESKHNKIPSLAVDAAPYFPGVKIDWNDKLAFARFYGYVERVAHEQGVRIRWGGDWDQDRQSADESFLDLVHFELV